MKSAVKIFYLNLLQKEFQTLSELFTYFTIIFLMQLEHLLFLLQCHWMFKRIGFFLEVDMLTLDETEKLESRTETGVGLKTRSSASRKVHFQKDWRTIATWNDLFKIPAKLDKIWHVVRSLLLTLIFMGKV